MNKLILILLIIAGVWWYQTDPVANSERLHDLARDTHTTYETVVAADIPARVQRLTDVRRAVEAQLHRAEFVPLDNLPIYFRQAVVAIEDKRFYDHGPVDFIGIGRALVTNYQAGETLEGGSTITQQTAKTLFLSQDRSWWRKAEELLLASGLERAYTKDEILEIYVNTVYYGAGAYGIGAAAQTYFGKSAAELSLAECTLLAGLPQAPSAYNPLAHYDAAKIRQQQVLAAMTLQGMISPQTAEKAYAGALPLQGRE
ncbi:MAG: transglycosylase domain-containing protein [Veillonellaceae bacterium]|nr:transglycosylase domain-containing protein [Veillonellaceae bacterium]